MRCFIRPIVFVTATLLGPASIAGAQPTIIERQVIVHGSIGQPGRERAFLTCYNPDQVAVEVSAQFLNHGLNVHHRFVIPGQGPSSIELATVPFMPAKAYFSVDISADAFDGQATAARCALTHHRASDFAEVGNQPAEVVRSPKR